MELTLNNRLIDNNNYGFDLQITGSTNSNKILSLGQGITPVPTGNRATQYNAPGYPLYGLWGKPVRWNDANGDGILAVNEVCNTGCSAADTAIYFSPTAPTREFAINPRFEMLHRKLAISAQIDHKQGMNKFNNTLRHQSQGGLSAQGFWDPNATLKQQACTIAVNNYADLQLHVRKRHVHAPSRSDGLVPDAGPPCEPYPREPRDDRCRGPQSPRLDAVLGRRS